MKPTPLAYHDGKFVPVTEVKVGIMTHALHYGTAVFEGIRGNWNEEEGKVCIFRPREHYVRFLDGAKVLRMKLPVTADDLTRLTVELIGHSDYRGDVYIRPIAFKSSQLVANLKLHEVEDDFAIIAVPFGSYLDSAVLRCITASWRRMDETMIPPRVKLSGLYVNSILAKTDAVLAGFDEAILLNNEGFVSEGSGENLFLVKHGQLVTPPLYNGILPGITRDTVMELARKELDLSVVERPIGRAELYLADEVFLTGTAAHVTAMGELDNRKIADGGVGPVTKQIQDLYFKVIRGKAPKYRHWTVTAVPAALARA
ncbi:MAG: branched-chain amino acid transaminase [Dehalococcoidia bacterium]|nr:branched-chain amino acid transaminase [Dehalococcoidia bacterium]